MRAATPSKNAENKLNSHIFIERCQYIHLGIISLVVLILPFLTLFENYRLGVTKTSYYFPNLKIPQALWFIYYANTFQIRKIVCMLFFAASKGNPSILRDPDS